MKNSLSTKYKADKELIKDSKIPGSLKNNKNDLISEKLKESEMRYRRLFETAKDGILILDYETGNIVDVNPFIVKTIDFSLEEILGKKLWEIGLFGNKEQSELAFIELKKNNYIRFEDMPLKKKNGKKIEVEFICNVYLVNNTKVIQCNIRDITERKGIERRQELTSVILTILSSRDNWDQSITEILVEIKDYTGMEAVGIRLKEGDDYPYYKTIGFPEYFLQWDNYLCCRDENGEIMNDEKGKPSLKGMCGNVISAHTDASLPYFTKGGSFYSNSTTQFLRDTAELESQSETINRSNAEGYESIALIPLYSGSEIIGLLQLNDKQPDMFSLDMIRFFERTGNTIGIAFNRIRSENKIKESEQNLKNQNTDFINLNREYTVLNEDLTESVHHIQDINDELISSKVKAVESDTLKSAFLANMSHEIRTPMNAIMGFSNFLLQPELPKEKLQDFVQIINASCLQLLSVISDIIDISKIEAGQITIDSELVDINNLLKELFVTYKKLVELKKLSLYYSVDSPDDNIMAITDGNRIKQVLCNLLNNAIKFTLSGKIEFGYKIKNNFIEFYVKDTGIGMAMENHEIIFQRFRQVETTKTRVFGGNGLGLSISKALVEKLGGTMAVSSELGTGSTFTFTIPYKKEIESSESTARTAESQSTVNWKEKTILIVEDEINNHAYMEELLSDSHVKLLHAWNGRDAVENVKNHSDITLVLMDIKMPIMDGYEATRLIKQIRPELKVIAQTAYALSHDREEAIEAGCDNYISKPIPKEVLVELLGGYLN